MIASLLLVVISVQFASTSSSEAENVSPAEIAVTLSAPSSQTVTCTYTVTGGSAGPADYSLPNPKVVSFAPGETIQTIPMTVTNDNVHEGDEDVIIILQFATNAQVGQPAGHDHVITDDDGTPVIQFALAGSSGPEGTNASVDVVTSSTLSGYAISMDYAAFGGNAVNGSDYTLAPGTVTFFPNDHVKTITFPVASDGQEWDEKIVLGLSNPGDGGSGVPVLIGENREHVRIIPGDGPSFCTAPPADGNCLPGPPNPPQGIVWCCR